MSVKRPLFLAALAVCAFCALPVKFAPEIFIGGLNAEYGESVSLTGRVSEIEEKAYSVYIYLKDAFIAGEKSGYVLLVFKGDKAETANLHIGNIISCEAVLKEWEKARNFGNFDEESYYRSIGLKYKLSAETVELTDTHVDLCLEFLRNLRERLCAVLEEIAADEDGMGAAGVLAAMVTGERSGIPEETKELYQASGISHILAISGLHVSFVGLGIFSLLRIKFRFGISAAAGALAVICFCLMSGAGASSMRALIMFFVSMCAKIFGRKYDLPCSLALAAILLLVENPFYITNTGFLLSFGAIFSIGTVAPALSTFFEARTLQEPDTTPAGFYVCTEKSGPAKAKALRKAGKRLSEALILSFSVNIFTLPAVASSYYYFSLLGVFLNLIVIPLMAFVLSGAMLGSLAGLFSLFLGRFLVSVSVYSMALIDGLCLIASYVPYSNICTGNPGALRIIVYYLALAALVIILKILTGSAALRRGRANFKKVTGILIICLFFAGMVFILTGGHDNGNLRIYFYDVGQGDGILIETPAGNLISIDMGSGSVSSVYRYRLRSAMLYDRHTEIDYAVITHPDTDHMSGVLEILEEQSEKSNGSHIKINNVLIYDFQGNENYDELTSAAKDAGVKVTFICAGYELSEPDFSLTCLHPADDFTSAGSNDYSAVLSLNYGNFSALFTGDIGEDVESELLKQGVLPENIDLLKVAHHGSKYSSSEAFLSYVNPEFSVISAGVNNIYGHPSEDTLDRLEDVKSKVYVTSGCGEVVFTVDREGSVKIDTALE